MVFRKFRIELIIRILILVVTILAFVLLINTPHYEVTGIICGLLVIVFVVSLIRYVERTNRKITHFLESIRFSDFSSTFSVDDAGKSFSELNTAFNEVMEVFRKTRAEKEEHYNYLMTLVQHVSIGIIAFKKDGTVDIFNNAARKLFEVPSLRNIQELAQVKPDLPETFLRLKAGDRILYKLFLDNEMMQLSVYATEFRMREEEYVLVSVQNIHNELEEKEIESWQNLIRVLTHEIMNSITPISSLASTVQEMIYDEDSGQFRQECIAGEDAESVKAALATIRNRSNGLLHFVEVYRNLTRIPKPNFRYFRIREMLDRVETLLRPNLEDNGIVCDCSVFPPDLMLTADPDLIDQVIINLVLNAIDAVKNRQTPRISLLASSNSSNRIIIEIGDNGHGITPDLMDKIFMPFFTSKKEGTGIGLSLSRQIMHLHKGTIGVRSKPDEGTVFTLTF